MPEPASPELRAKVAEQAAQALEKQRSLIVKECWKPSAKKEPKPSKLTLPIRLGFNPEGELERLSTGHIADESRVDVGDCIRGLKLKLSVPAPGKVVGVQVELKLP